MKRLGLLIVMLLVSMNFYAQLWDNSKPDKRFTFGVRAGANLLLGNLTSDGNTSGAYDFVEIAKTKKLPGIHAGMIVDYNIIKSFAIESGLLYSLKRFGLDPAKDNNDEYSDNYSLSYIQIPIAALLRFPINNEVQLEIKTGAFLDLLLNDIEFAHFMSEYWDHHIKFEKSYAGLLIGLGVNINNIIIGMQYEHGINDIINQWHYCYHNRNLAISIGYNF